MTTYDVEIGDFDGGATVSLPSGSDGDQMVLLTFSSASPSTITGWVREDVYREFPDSTRLAVYTRTRDSSETTVDLPFVSPDVQNAYAIISATGVVYDSYVADVRNGEPSWVMDESFSREDPRLAFMLHHSGLIDSATGDFVAEGDWIDGSGGGEIVEGVIVDGNMNRAYVADETGAGTLEFDATGYWSTGGGMAWITAFFSPPLSAGNPWTVGRVAWGTRGAWH